MVPRVKGGFPEGKKTDPKTVKIPVYKQMVGGDLGGELKGKGKLRENKGDDRGGTSALRQKNNQGKDKIGAKASQNKRCRSTAALRPKKRKEKVKEEKYQKL